MSAPYHHGPTPSLAIRMSRIMASRIDLMLALSATAVILLILSKRMTRSSPSLPPGPAADPLIGHIRIIRGEDAHVFFHELSQKYGKVICLRVPRRTLIILNSNKAAIDLLEKRSSVYSDRPASEVLSLMGFANNLVFFPYGDDFRRHRRLLNEYFHQKKCISYQAIQSQAAHKLLQNLVATPEKSHTHGNPHKRYSVSIILRVAHGHEIVEENDPYLKIIEDVEYVNTHSAPPGSSFVDLFPFLKHMPSWFPGTSAANQAREFRPLVDRMHDYPFEDMKQKLANSTALESLLSREMEKLYAGEGSHVYTAEDLKSAAAVVYVAGADTTFCMLLIFMLAMILYPEVKLKAQEEIDRCTGGSRLPQFEDRQAAILPSCKPHNEDIDSQLPCLMDPVNSPYEISGAAFGASDVTLLNPDPPTELVFTKNSTLNTTLLLNGRPRYKIETVDAALSKTDIKDLRGGNAENGKVVVKLRKRLLLGDTITPAAFKVQVPSMNTFNSDSERDLNPITGRPSSKNSSFKEWDINDKGFTFSPPSNKEDPWAVMVEPLLKKDAVLCTRWKEEVENLLIFAGLFSAVVTTFVVESYKSLQPDPEVEMVALLLRIADRLDNASSPALASGPFVQDPAAVRINSFWLWLRAHQAYSDLTSKQMFAVYRMRSEGMEKWHVREVFTALPLLLQAALVLFLAGMVDFVLVLGKRVYIPVIMVIAFTLLFLLITTVLPTIQGFYFYFTGLYSSRTVAGDLNAPAPCPYKSPQSRAFRRFSRPAFTLLSSIVPRIIRSARRIARRVTLVRLYGFVLPQELEEETKVHRIIPLLSDVWNRETWTEFDIGWLTIRDEYAQGPERSLIGSELYQDGWLEDLFPVYDVTIGIKKALGNPLHRGDKNYVHSAYHCFAEISRSAVDRVKELKQYYSGDTERHHDYFQKLLLLHSQSSKTKGVDHDRPALSDYIDAESSLDMLFPAQYSAFLHYGNMMTFLTVLAKGKKELLWERMRLHKSELKIRATSWVYSVGCRTSSKGSTVLPTCLDISSDERNDWLGMLESSDIDEKKAGYELCCQYLSLIARYFEATESQMEEDWGLYANANHFVPVLLSNASEITLRIMDSDLSAASQSSSKAQSDFLATNTTGFHIFASIIKHIQRRISEMLHAHNHTLKKPNSRTGARNCPNSHLLFYTAAMYLRPLATTFLAEEHVRECVYSILNEVLPILARYRRHIFYAAGQNSAMEYRFRGKGLDSALRFSPEWWNFLDMPTDDASVL
ncbi:hypothetical protein D9613_003540 [Agrocybe pediades]|uniref:DUF6535 domain-containing protein n=1 Tax=Agrocybe pediades TaxID=84607 RepID=A0A8H4QRI1_9AGAR|nr:hypothetical protein D9613_003540 [Agrocybe pediades]